MLKYLDKLISAVLPKMIERKSGHVVFNSSVQGLISIPNRSAYAASKHALQAFGDCLRAEMDQYGINVTVVSPGYIKTAISMNAFTGSGDTHGGKYKSFINCYTSIENVLQKKIVLKRANVIPLPAIYKSIKYIKYQNRYLLCRFDLALIIFFEGSNILVTATDDEIVILRHYRIAKTLVTFLKLKLC